MPLLDLVFKRSKDDPLAAFDENEADDLALHVRQCARRYASIVDKISTSNALLWILIIVLILTRVIDVPEALSKILGT